MKALLIGCGQMGFVHLQRLLANQYIQEVIIVEPDKHRRQKIAEQFIESPIILFERLNEALACYDTENAGPGICVIASNSALHGEHVSKIISKFNHYTRPPLLFVEKPLLENIFELETITPQLFSYRGNLIGGYLLRYSWASQLLIEYLVAHKLKIISIDVIWTKSIVPDRTSPGVLVDETTHAIDFIWSYLLPRSGFSFSDAPFEILSLEGIRSNAVIDVQKQYALYGTLTPPVLAELKYQFLANGYYQRNQKHKISIKGYSSFISPSYERSVRVLCTGNVTIECQFDMGKKDHFFVYKDNIEMIQHSFRVDKVEKEINHAITYQLNFHDKGPAADLSDMIKVIKLIHEVEQKLLSSSAHKYMNQQSQEQVTWKKKGHGLDPVDPSPSFK